MKCESDREKVNPTRFQLRLNILVSYTHYCLVPCFLILPYSADDKYIQIVADKTKI